MLLLGCCSPESALLGVQLAGRAAMGSVFRRPVQRRKVPLPHLFGCVADDEEAAAGLVQRPAGQSTAMDVEGTSQQPAATGLAEGGPDTASQQEQQHDQQHRQQASGEGPAAAAATGAGQGGPEGGAAAEEVAAPPPVSVPSFLAAAAAVPGAEAEEEDYDE